MLASQQTNDERSESRADTPQLAAGSFIEKVWANMKKFLRNSLHKFSSLDDAIYSFFQVE